MAAEVFRKVDPSLKVEVYLHDGEAVAPGAVVMLIEGSARSILGAERTALNFIQRLSGVATLTRKYVKAVSHTSARILTPARPLPATACWKRQPWPTAEAPTTAWAFMTAPW